MKEFFAATAQRSRADVALQDGPRRRATRRTGSSPASSSPTCASTRRRSATRGKRGMGTTIVDAVRRRRRRLRRPRRRLARLPLPRRQDRAAHRGPLAAQRLHQDEAPHGRGDRELPAQERHRARARDEGHGQGRHALRDAARAATSTCSAPTASPARSRTTEMLAHRHRVSTDLKTAARQADRARQRERRARQHHRHPRALARRPHVRPRRQVGRNSDFKEGRKIGRSAAGARTGCDVPRAQRTGRPDVCRLQQPWTEAAVHLHHRSDHVRRPILEPSDLRTFLFHTQAIGLQRRKLRALTERHCA